jgi:hypothetical protein
MLDRWLHMVVVAAPLLAGALGAQAPQPSPGAGGAAAVEVPDEVRRAAERVAALAGPKWQVGAARVVQLQGWSGRTHAYVLRGTNRALAVGQAPATFRFTLAPYGWSGSAVAGEADPDLPMGASDHYFWFSAGESYSRARPEEWQALVAAVRRELGIPEPVDGIQCRLEVSRDLFLAGEPLEAWVRARNVSQRSVTLTELPSLAPYLRVAGADGKPLAAKETAAHERWPARVLQPWEEYGTALRVDAVRAFPGPGVYTVALDLPLDEAGTRHAPSQTLSLRIAPADLLALTLSTAGAPARFQGTVPVELAFTSRADPAEPLSDLRLTYQASREGPDGWGIWGDPEVEGGDAVGRLAGLPSLGRTLLKLDLARAKWENGFSSQWPGRPFRGFAGPGTSWQVRAHLTGRLGGRRFEIQSPAVAVRIANPDR